MTKLAIVSAWVGPVPNEVRQVRLNHEQFAANHGYDYLHFDEKLIAPIQQLVQGDGDAHWIKPGVMREALRGYEWVFWTDLDSVFHDASAAFDDLTAGNWDFVFTGDHNDLFNGGHLLLRRSDFSENLLNDWEALQKVPFPRLSTTQQGPDGYVGDQIAMNYLLAGGSTLTEDVQRNAATLVNRTNGWVGNSDRHRKRFAQTHAPTSRIRLFNATRLVSPKLRPHVKIVVQNRLNAYPWWGPKGAKNRRGPIVHFVSPYKDLLADYLGAHWRGSTN